MRILLLCSFIGALQSVAGSPPVVRTKLGPISGFEYETAKGTTANIFLNIPYAQPPVGDLRYEKPVPVSSWTSPLNATAYGFDCFTHVARAALNKASEDCLTLNVITPSKKAPEGGFPVLFWIHGGGYEIGSASIYGYKGFADRYSTEDVIVVTIQYRLGFLGFYSSGDSTIPGNLGLWDQTMALKFVHTHISSFGGDPSRITAWGLSAGGSSVGQLSLSPHSRDYIWASIEMSGSPWVSWALGSKVPENSKNFAEALQCGNDVKACLKGKTIQELHAAVDAIGCASDNLAILRFSPVIDGDFLPYSPSQLVKEAPPKPSIVGVSEKDAAFFTIMGLSPYIHKVGVAKDKLSEFDKADLMDRIERYLLSSDFGKDHAAAVKEAFAYYSKGAESKDQFLDRYTDFVSDVMFSVPSVDEIKEKRANGYKVYAYSFDHYNQVIYDNFGYGVPDNVKGSVHVNEFPYMFDLFVLGKFEWKGADEVVRDTTQSAIISFAKTGVPRVPNGEWTDVGSEDKLDYLAISGNPHMAKGYFHEAATFWNSMRKYSYDMISMTPTAAKKDEL